MSIKKIKVSNFKSFGNIEIELGNLNVLIGANAAGKSNFIQMFRFLRDIAEKNLADAISLQGEMEYLANISIGSKQDIEFELMTERKIGFPIEEDLGFKAEQSFYTFRLTVNGTSFSVTKDEFKLKGKYYVLERAGRKFKEKKELGTGFLSFFNNKGKLDFRKRSPKTVSINKENFLPRFPEKMELGDKSLLLEGRFLFLPFFFNLESFSKVAIYDFDPKHIKETTPITGKADLEEDGRNLALILRKLLSDKENVRKLDNLITDILPFIKEVRIERLSDRSLLTTIRETYFDERKLPATFISDGTLNLTAMIIALYFQKSPITIIEEPERNIHPHLISQVVDMMKDASSNKQIIVTTHNPEIVKHADLESLLLVSRDENGFSTIARPKDKKMVKVFLENELGIEDLYVQNLLTV